MGDTGAGRMLLRHVLGERLEQGLVVEGVDGEVKTGHDTDHLSAELRAVHVSNVDTGEEVGGGGCLREQPVRIGTQWLVIVFSSVRVLRQHEISVNTSNLTSAFA